MWEGGSVEVLLYKPHGEVGVARVSAEFSMDVPLVFCYVEISAFGWY